MKSGYFDMENQLLFDIAYFSHEFKNIARIYFYDTLFHKVYKKDIPVIQHGLIEDFNGNIEKTHPFTGEIKKFKMINQHDRLFWRERKNGGLNSCLNITQQAIYEGGYYPGYWFHKSPRIEDVYSHEFYDCRSLHAMAFDIETEVIKGVPDPKVGKEKIISCAFSWTQKDGSTKTIVAYVSENEEEVEGYETIWFETEEELIQFILRILFNEPLAPIIVGFNSKDFDIPYILKRAEILKIPHYYELHPEYEELRKSCYWDYPHVDIYRLYSNFGLKGYVFKGKYPRNTLRDIAIDQLEGLEKLHVDFQHHTIQELVTYNARDTEITLKLFQKAIDPILLLSRVSRCPLSVIQNTTISTWVKNIFDFMLLDNGFFLLSKYQKKLREESDDDGEEQTGGLVLKPPTGIFKNVCCFDFSSEYPTIVISQNLSFENVNVCDHPECPISLGSDLEVIQNESNNLVLEKRKDPTKVCMKKRGLFSFWMETLRNYRVNIYKKLSKTDKRYIPWSEGIKLLMNSSVGVFGSKNFEYHSPALFNAVTRMGQYSLFQLKSIIDNIFPHHKVIYGATDSIFVLPSSLEDIKRDAPKIIEIVKNKLNLDLEFEKTFELIFFSGAKSNYLAFHKETLKNEVKGLTLNKSSTFEGNRKYFEAFIDDLKKYLKENPDWDNETLSNYIKNKIISYIYLLIESDNPEDFMFSNPYKDQDYKSNPPHRQAYEKMTSIEKLECSDSGVIKYYKTKEGYEPISKFRKDLVDIDKYIELLIAGYTQITKSLDLDLESMFLKKKTDTKRKKTTKNEEIKKPAKSLLDFL